MREKLPVTQETHIEDGEESASEICSGKFPVTFLLNLGWSIGKSALPRRNEGSKRRVLGWKGPSRVVGIASIPAKLMKIVRAHNKSWKCILDEANVV